LAGISENRIFRCLPVFFSKREKNPWRQTDAPLCCLSSEEKHYIGILLMF
jgi:hypothetical protein